MDKELQLLKDLTDAHGVSGYEHDVKKVLQSYLEPNSDELIHDKLGGIFGKKNATNGSKTILIGGHLDEVGFMVTDITKEGFLKFTPIGGWWSQVMLSQRMNVITEQGVLTGIIGSKPPHVLTPEDRKKTVEIKDMFIDIGVKDKEEAESFGVQIGDQITPYMEFTEMANKNYLLAKAWDNRFGCAVASQVLAELNGEDVNVNVASGATVQEEVGLRGAKTAAAKVKPDLAIAVDVGLALDTPDMPKNEGEGNLGDGPLLLLLDATNIGHVGFRKHVQKVIKDKGLPVQLAMVTKGGTDSGSFHVANEGVPSLSIGVPLRYMHSNASIMHREDFQNTVKLIVEIVKSLDDEAVDSIIYGK
ncbi:M42 family metallopeptidase [Abyssicoccus albus]|uniref:Putative aminopeptidase FrvX n=1 Tax=Abyssicoccus albus TaxID=1817405 RepID=A0A3N5BRR7_9BACL|nr:M42 family metallopeptidase [Abyssicoccus albus]RPF57740.1 putative aminopeptidase FrvX [Abyssicoccus albus]